MLAAVKAFPHRLTQGARTGPSNPDFEITQDELDNIDPGISYTLELEARSGAPTSATVEGWISAKDFPN